jgi:hypothetical protein
MCENDSTASLLHYVIPTQNSAKIFPTAISHIYEMPHHHDIAAGFATQNTATFEQPDPKVEQPRLVLPCEKQAPQLYLFELSARKTGTPAYRD